MLSSIIHHKIVRKETNTYHIIIIAYQETRLNLHHDRIVDPFSALVKFYDNDDVTRR